MIKNETKLTFARGFGKTRPHPRSKQYHPALICRSSSIFANKFSIKEGCIKIVDCLDHQVLRQHFQRFIAQCQRVPMPSSDVLERRYTQRQLTKKLKTLEEDSVHSNGKKDEQHPVHIKRRTSTMFHHAEGGTTERVKEFSKKIAFGRSRSSKALQRLSGDISFLHALEVTEDPQDSLDLYLAFAFMN